MERHSRKTRQKLLDCLQEGIDANTPGNEMIYKTLDFILKVHEENPDLNRVLMDEIPQSIEFHKQNRQSFSRFGQHITSLLNQRLSQCPEKTKRFTQFLSFSIQSIIHAYVCYPHENMDREDFLNETTRLIYQYLKTED